MVTKTNSAEILHLGLPKGRMQEGVFKLLSEAGIHVELSARGYRPRVNLSQVETKILKPQNIVEMLHLGSRDVGFAGADWVVEFDAGLVELLDTGLNPVQLVAAAPTDLLVDGQLPPRRLIVASEYERLTKRWIQDQGLDAQFIRTFGATEVFPPEDADLIVDNSASGATLADNNLQIVDELMKSSTRLYANPAAYDDAAKRQRIDDLTMLLRAVLEGRRRAMLEVNVSTECLEQVIEALPAMQRPTVAPLFGNAGFAVRAAVLRCDLPRVIPRVKAAGGRDIVVSNLNQIVP